MLPKGMSEELVDAVRSIFGTRLLSVVLYGSVARGEQTPESDVDIALFLREPLSIPGVAGAVMIIGSAVVSEIRGSD